ncbi:MAG: type I secretion system permease/ATPase [Rhodobacteraceae bacterium]|nr:type I secretion system permease/ATPase [Paracoccaceae bacterium]
MQQTRASNGRAELRSVGALSRGPLIAAFLFSVVVNLLMLTSPLYMLQVYDRVLVSRSEPTLLALSVLATAMFVFMGILDFIRGRVLARIGVRMQAALDARVLSAAFRKLTAFPGDPTALAAQQDLDAISRLWSSPMLTAILDLPWVPIFAAALFIFDPLLGWFAMGGAAVLVLITILNQRSTAGLANEATVAALMADRRAENLKSESELVRSMGMTSHAFARWQELRGRALERAMSAADVGGAYSVTTRTLRLFLQSAILGLGAWLVLKGELSAGAMIAGSILMGRALQPIETAIGQWQVLTRARAGAERLSRLLSEVPPEQKRTALPRPVARIEVSGLSVVPPGERIPTLRNINFRLEPGQAIGVIGTSGSGKSTLARAMTGVWSPAAGTIRLDGATLDQYDPDTLGSYVGYLPQRVSLFDGTIAENIARLDMKADPERIVAAAKKAAVHELILKLPKGYDTPMATMGGQLSGGQIQRVGLARAFYGDPVLLVLDEPNSNLDNDGSMALNQAIRAAKAGGAAVMIMAHRPAAIQECDLLMVMKDGMVQTLGPRDQVLREAVKNASDVTRTIASGNSAPGGVS